MKVTYYKVASENKEALLPDTNILNRRHGWCLLRFMPMSHLYFLVAYYREKSIFMWVNYYTFPKCLALQL